MLPLLFYVVRSRPGRAAGPRVIIVSNCNAWRYVFNRNIAEDLQGVFASEILAESGTRKDTQMRHFTGEIPFFSSCWKTRWADDGPLPVSFG